MRSFAFLAVFLSLLVSLSRAAVSLDTDVTKRSVVLIVGADRQGNADKGAELATGFLIAVPREGSAESYHYLVTARHVVDPLWSRCSESNPTRIFVRVNTVYFDAKADNSGVEYLPIDLVAGGTPTWYAPADAHADVAVLEAPRGLSDGRYDVNFIRFRNFGMPDEISMLSIGSDVATAGLIPGLGRRRNYPIFKFGKVAGIPDDIVAWDCPPESPGSTLRAPGNPLRVWWIAINQVGGNSGAPIFFTPLFPPGIKTKLAEARPMIIGLQSLATTGSDIAGMTPAKYIIEVIVQHVGRDADLTLGGVPIPKAEKRRKGAAQF